MLQPFGHGPAAPFGLRLFLSNIGSAISFGKRDQALGRIGVAVKDYIFARDAQFCVNVLVNVQLPRIDDGHIKPCRDGVIEKDRVHCAAHGFITTETERQVGKPA